MSMEKEWKELKGHLAGKLEESCRGHLIHREILDFMTELEKRSLPERVAVLLKNLGADSKYYGNAWSIIADATKALETGDTTELEKWQK